MTIAARPPSSLIQSMVAPSRKVMQSQRILPWGVLMRMARWPMANGGSV